MLKESDYFIKSSGLVRTLLIVRSTNGIALDFM